METVKTKTKVKIGDIIKDKRAVYSVIEPGEAAGSGETLERGGVIIGSRNLDDIKMLSKLLIAKDFSYRIVSEFSNPESEYHGREIAHSYRREREGGGADSEHYRVTLTHEDLGMVELLKKALAGSHLALQKLDKKITPPAEKQDSPDLKIGRGKPAEKKKEEKSVSSSFWKWTKRAAAVILGAAALLPFTCNSQEEKKFTDKVQQKADAPRLTPEQRKLFEKAVGFSDLNEKQKAKLIAEMEDIARNPKYRVYEKDGKSLRGNTPLFALYNALQMNGGDDHLGMVGDGKNWQERKDNTGCMYAGAVVDAELAHERQMRVESEAAIRAAGGGR